jgi:hypothetical protein
LTPIALTVAKDVLGFLRVQLKKQADEHADEAFDWLVKKLFKRGDDEKKASTPAGGEPTPPPPEEPPGAELTDEQLEEVRKLAVEKAKLLKLPKDKAELLADSLVGSLATA